MRDDRERLLDMLEAIQKIGQYVYDENGRTAKPDVELVEVRIIPHIEFTHP